MTTEIRSLDQAPGPWPAHEISAGDYRATISGVGGGLASLTYRGVPLVVGYGREEIRPYYRGALLAPWPNRVYDARWRHGGHTHELAITEPARGHALHGLLAWAPFTVLEHEGDALTAVAEVPAQDGYPHHVLVQVAYRLDDAGGLDWALTAFAMSDGAPVGLGLHPYLSAGTGRVDDWSAHVPYRCVYQTRGPRLEPDGVVDVAEQPELDLTDGPLLAGRTIDHAYCQPSEEVSVIDVRSAVPDGAPEGVRGVRMVTEAPWLQVHTADRDDDPAANRAGLAVEPMTCAPGALNDLDGGAHPITVLALGESLTVACSISALTH
ncbi:MAG: hypothetical protein Q4P36_04155 [Bowdeniella nasicola]|nr:hypothetical protein [Bowdeniella nasicola]